MNKLDKEAIEFINKMKNLAHTMVEGLETQVTSKKAKDKIAATIYLDMGILTGKLTKILEREQNNAIE